jgi:hypothetical protein
LDVFPIVPEGAQKVSRYAAASIDGLRDDDEIRSGTSPVQPDTDGDGVGDGLERYLGTDPLQAASVPLSYFGFNPNDDGQLRLVGWTDQTTFALVRLGTHVPVEKGTLDRFQTTTVDMRNVRYFRLLTSAPLLATLGYQGCCNVGGSFFYPALDGKRLVGRAFLVQIPVLSDSNEFLILAHEASDVTIRDTAGQVVLQRSLPLHGFFVTRGASLGTGGGYQITATGDIALMSNAIDGFTAVPAADGSDVGTTFLFGTRAFGTGALALFAYADAVVSGSDLETGRPLFTRTLTAGEFAYLSGYGDTKMKVVSTGRIGVWAGATEGGDAIDFLGDDVALHTGEAGREFYVHSQSQGAVLFVTQNDTTVTIDGVATLLQAGQVHTLPAGALYHVVADKPMLVQTIGGNALNNWAMALRLVIDDRDRDGLADTEEVARGTDPTQPDTDGDGLRDGFEAAHGFDPLTPGEASQDPAGDGLDNQVEQTVQTDPTNRDTDRDGLSDGEEQTLGTDPRHPDTDRGGRTDGVEALMDGTNPTDPQDDQLPPIISRAEMGANQQLNDESYVEVSFANGFTFPFYGTTYTRVFVESNGRLTFTAGVPTYEVTPENFITQPQIALFFSDLDPGVDKPTDVRNVFVRQLADRVVVTYHRTPQYPNTGANTAQVTLYSDGRIVFAYLGMTTTDALIGVSPGAASTLRDVNLTIGQWSTQRTEALFEYLTGNFDLDWHFVVFTPNTAGGYDVEVLPFPDTDGDGMFNGFEIFYGFDPFDAADGDADPDGDGLDNLEEQWALTDPHRSDSDGDGLNDGEEVHTVGSDPNDIRN